MGSKENEQMKTLIPLLDVMGKKYIYCGGPGNGQIAKMCNNLALSI